MKVNMMPSCVLQLGAFLMLCCFIASPAFAATLHHTFVIQEASYTRLCNNTKNILTVNGSYPGPTLYARKGDTVFVKVINNGNKNITLHWHGIVQPRDPWSDGPEYITQCPIKPGNNFTQRVQITDEEGTLWWHAHSDLDRATVHGAIVIYPALNSSYPFTKPDREFILILGEWWNQDIEKLYNTTASGGDPAPSDANTINGQPGDFEPCSANGTFKVEVEQGKTYLLRVINSALNNEFFFAVAGHNVTVVGSDASYTKPYVNEYIVITPGQTFDLLLEANQFLNPTSSPYRYYINATPFFDGGAGVSRNPKATVAILEYKTNITMPPTVPISTSLPNFDNSSAAAAFTNGLRSLANQPVPTEIDEHMYITVSMNKVGNGGNAASLNNASFQSPIAKVDVLDAYYRSIAGVYTPDFPDNPPVFFNFTGNISSKEIFTSKSTKVKVLDYNTTVEIVFQGTNMRGGENHPMHLHGHSFYVVGSGLGNFNSTNTSYNLVNPPYQNTVGVPKNGWVAIRFRAANPGVWFMHCHYDRHTVWGMDTVFITKNGNRADQRMLPPPADRPRC